MKLLLLSLGMIIHLSLHSQNIGVGTTTPHPSALLDLTSTNQGILVPRMSSSRRNSISSPASGLLVFDTDTNSFWYIVPGVGWRNLAAPEGWRLTGNSGTDTAIHAIGTLDAKPLKFVINNQPAGLLTNNGAVYLGVGSGPSAANLTSNVGIGLNALRKNTYDENLAIGQHALSSQVSSFHNLALGPNAMQFHTNGHLNVALGAYSLWAQTNGSNNTAIGADVLGNHLRGNNNTAVGTNALFYDTVGVDNTSVGVRSLRDNLDGVRNTAIGTDALLVNVSGSNNTAVGYKATVMGTGTLNATAIGAMARADCNNCLVLGSVASINGAAANVNVGIGTTNPTRPLSFPAALGKKISLYPGSTGDVGFGVYGNELRLHSDHGSADITFGYDDFANGFTERMRIRGTGEVGIGMNPSFRLDVNGTVRCTELIQTSDQRLKENIRPLENPLPQLVKINGYTYYWKDPRYKKELRTGLLAQQVRHLFPHLVKEDPDGMLAIDYTGLIPVMIESIKEQQKQIDELKSLVQQLLNK